MKPWHRSKLACQTRSATFGRGIDVLDVLLDQLAAIGAQRGIDDAAIAWTRAASNGARDWRMPSNARITSCCRATMSSEGRSASHAAADFADAIGSAPPRTPGVRNPNIVERRVSGGRIERECDASLAIAAKRCEASAVRAARSRERELPAPRSGRCPSRYSPAELFRHPRERSSVRSRRARTQCRACRRRLARHSRARPSTAPVTPQRSSKLDATINELQKIDVKQGTGAEAIAGKIVIVHYTGWLYDQFEAR